MAFCEQCGNPIPDDASECPICHTPVTYDQPAETDTFFRGGSFFPQTFPSETADEDSPVVTKNLVLASNEEIVQQYVCSNIKVPRCIGYLTVTNKRLIFEGKATSSRIAKEISLDSVSGLDCYYGTNINMKQFIFAALMCLLGLYLLFSPYDSMKGFGTILLMVSLLIAALSSRNCFYLSIFSSKASGTPINIGGGPQTKLGNGALYSLTSEPSDDTDRMLNELGAMIQDLQTMGDHAIEKWKK